MGRISVVGLGPGDLEQLPMGVYRLLKSDQPVYLRTKLHPAVSELEEEGFEFHSFDAVYENNGQFEGVYETISKELLELANNQDIIYAVPGHPMVAEKSVQLLLASKQGIEINIKGGKSFLDDLFQAVQIDPIEGFQLVDALDLKKDELELGQHIIIMQVFNQYIASDVKLILTEKYPDDHVVAFVHAAGSKTEEVEWLPLVEIDRMQGVHNLTSMYIPPLARDDQTKSFQTAQYYIDLITGETGDSWIKKQTHESLIPYLKEETAEFIEAIEKEDDINMVEELGDILMQVLYHTNLGERSGYFSLEEVLETLNKKLRRRHPHVFDEVEAASIEEVEILWQKIKSEEMRRKE
ncbi:tetrapyrrole methylase family protein / MazG family protein [Carnobacterium iners]|uniref:Tetrapyrrole methylase family protein / MazG family protein n=1 Tax=Carnobacterium iners TaxID=1073423 RepID=A0A1X7MRI4_9LACT|nr:MazG nucleotide pyrophosphohydrolase domain-containing protein [Carnobacterium iners]SEK98220.1 tetrapyrrole methylase family protein / MazG family protein [Carnobacterium iners]SMH27234.1 tetrapyrrole methylase family protein / MazG family protein [Carnobacterium iners]